MCRYDASLVVARWQLGMDSQYDEEGYLASLVYPYINLINYIVNDFAMYFTKINWYQEP